MTGPTAVFLLSRGELTAIWGATIAIINPRGDFPLLDDWDFAIATRNFAQSGHFAGGSDLNLLQPFTYDHDEIERVIRELDDGGGKTRFYDALSAAVGLLQHDVGKTVGPLFLTVLQVYAVTCFWKASKQFQTGPVPKT